MAVHARRRFGVMLRVSALGLLLACCSRDAAAQTPSELATAKRWFAEGLASEENADYAAALDRFRSAAQIKKTPQIVYHVGFCEGRTGLLVEAMLDLDTAATLARSAGADNVVLAATSELAEVKKRVPSLEVHVGGQDKPGQLIVDGHVIALSMLGVAMPLNPGNHTVSVAFASGATATTSASLVEHDSKTVELGPGAPPAVAPVAPPALVAPPVAVAPAPVAPLEPPPPAPAPPPPTGAAHRSPLPWIVGGAGGVAAVTGIVLFAVAEVDAGTLDSQCPSHSHCDRSLEGTYSGAKTLDAVGLAVGAVGLAAVGVGVTMLVLRPAASTSSAIVVGPTGVAWTGRF